MYGKTCIPHGECLKEKTRNWGYKWDFGCQGTPRHENCERRLNRVHRNIILWVDVRSWAPEDDGII